MGTKKVKNRARADGGYPLQEEDQLKNYNFTKKKINRFTVIELVLSMAVLSVICVMMVQIFNTTTSTTERTSSETEVNENAKIAMDLITIDIESAYNGEGKAPFFHSVPENLESPPTDWQEYRNEMIAFISTSSILPNEHCTSSFCEIKYQLYYGDDENRGWLRRSITGNKDEDGNSNSKWNWLENFQISYLDSSSAFTIDDSSSDEYKNIIPYITKIEFTCYDDTGDKIKQEISSGEGTGYTGSSSTFPNRVRVDLTLMDRKSWNKWISLGGNVNIANDPEVARIFREKKEKKFSKYIHLGDRGQ
ncbi:MAG: hypothetical protein GY756_19900 [bacterium]|nr:hypothetical protein [bacterium]